MNGYLIAAAIVGGGAFLACLFVCAAGRANANDDRESERAYRAMTPRRRRRRHGRSGARFGLALVRRGRGLW